MIDMTVRPDAENQQDGRGRVPSVVEPCLADASEDFLHRHPGCQELQQHLDRIAQPTDDRLAVADRRVGGDALEGGN